MTPDCNTCRFSRKITDPKTELSYLGCTVQLGCIVDCMFSRNTDALCGSDAKFFESKEEYEYDRQSNR